MRPEPALVWMVREGDPTAMQGTLSIERAELRFVPAPAEAAPLTIPLREIHKVRRGRAAPLLGLTYRDPDGSHRLFIYFAKPPPLPGDRPPAQVPIFRAPRGLERSAAALAFGASNRLLKGRIDAWVRALREGAGG